MAVDKDPVHIVLGKIFDHVIFHRLNYSTIMSLNYLQLLHKKQEWIYC